MSMHSQHLYVWSWAFVILQNNLGRRGIPNAFSNNSLLQCDEPSQNTFESVFPIPYFRSYSQQIPN